MLVEATACQSWHVFLRHSVYFSLISSSYSSLGSYETFYVRTVCGLDLFCQQNPRRWNSKRRRTRGRKPKTSRCF